MTKQQYRWNLRHKKNNENLGTVYLGNPLPIVDDIIAIGEKKYKIIEIKPGSSYDSTDVFVSEAPKDTPKA